MKFKAISIAGMLAISLALGACKSTKLSQSASKEEQVKEIAPGLLQGYLSKVEMPNSLLLIPPPPEEGTPGFALDQDYASKAVQSKDSTRRLQAADDAYLYFPEAARSFDSAVGMVISDTTTPKLYMLMRRVLTDAALSTYTAKNHYKRKRPFMFNNTPTCTPEDEELLRKDGSYPSGHTAIGWAWALVFCEIFPAKSDAILQRGYAFGESRILCNVHWHSDVEMGRVVGAAAVAKLHANPVFQRDLAAAKEEVKKKAASQ